MSTPELNLILDDLEDRNQLEDADALFSAFSTWAEETGRPLYPHQEEAILAIFAQEHVIVATPTGSGKSMIALAGHFKALAAGERSYYTAPLKALVSEKFFDLVAIFGAQNVGMITGDVSLNPLAPIICCTAEILANQALREAEGLDVGLVVMDEFHFYGDPERGWAWQVPLLTLPQAQQVLMSATLGDVSFFLKDLKERSGREAVLVEAETRPVPLEMEYTLEPTHELLERLIQQGRYPIYLVHFSQRSALASAQALLSANLLSKEHKARIAEAIGDFRFNTKFGRTLSKLLRHGVGLHHAGMLPRYRRLVERLAQAGVLAVVCGTDTLGVGINVPITSVVFTALTKFDGSKERHLSAREFHQVAGRAGRAGFDTIGYVEVQAPEHVIENARALAKAEGDPKKVKKITRKSAPEGRVNWTEATFDRLVAAPPEPLTSNFLITPAMVMNVLSGFGEEAPDRLVRLATENHDPVSPRNLHLRQLGQIYRSLLTAEVLKVAKDGKISINRELPDEFALNAPLSTFVFAALDLLNPEDPTYALDLISLVEATLEDPRLLLVAQQHAERGHAIAAMKAQGMDYDARMEALEEVTWPKPLAELLEPAFTMFAKANPWVAGEELKPKSVVRFMVENAMTYSDLIARFDLGAAEGSVLRYLTDAYRALRQVIPPQAANEEFENIVSWLGNLIRLVDSSLLDEWESFEEAEHDPAEVAELVAKHQNQTGSESTPEAAELPFGADADGRISLSANPYVFRNLVAKDLFKVVELLAADRPENLAKLGFPGWDEDAFDECLDRYWAEYDFLETGTEARSAQYLQTWTEPTDADFAMVPAPFAPAPDLPVPFPTSGAWLVKQTLLDPEGDLDWAIWALVDLAASDEAGQPVIRLLSVSPH
ncbi:DEAD/DEAH box helicase [Boudabousia liubingyangii]|uniref:DEAD/DEAH box helicase n=1 Tax=Boudabousia liubingyangii TaxID=1921764 RepID=UPI00093A2923|nr:DEAD/DEAH box helicase [Boudabousia liubingyangii]OKL47407.1 DEAD/DEAH box helicase [Boudabousia liubingyangii]